jgi:RNA polymerase primary sigma factor
MPVGRTLRTVRRHDPVPARDVGVVSPRVPSQRQPEVPDSVRLYLREIGRIPLLSAVDEVRLAQDIEVGILADERLTTAAAGEFEERADLAYLADVGCRAKARLVQSNLRLVVAVARRYSGPSASLLDLIQEGNIGLIRAVEKFDYKRGFKFSTYATWWIRQAISRGLADQSRTIRVPVHVIEAMHRVVRTQRALFQALSRNPTVDELSERLQLSPARTRELLRLVDEPVSLDLPIGDGDSGHLADLIIDDSTSLPLEQVGLLMLHADVELLLGDLTPRERLVLRMRFGLEGGRTHTLEEVGAALGVTRERARQIESKALTRIRRMKSMQGLRDYLE